MGCSTCSSPKKNKAPVVQTVNYVVKRVSNGEIVGEYGAKVNATVAAKKLPFVTQVHPVEISSTEEKPKAEAKKKAPAKPKVKK